MAATPWSFGAPEGKISRAWPAGWWTVSTSPFRSLLFGADGASAATGPGGTLPDRRVAACRRCPRDTYGGGDAGWAWDRNTGWAWGGNAGWAWGGNDGWAWGENAGWAWGGGSGVEIRVAVWTVAVLAAVVLPAVVVLGAAAVVMSVASGVIAVAILAVAFVICYFRQNDDGDLEGEDPLKIIPAHLRLTFRRATNDRNQMPFTRV